MNPDTPTPQPAHPPLHPVRIFVSAAVAEWWQARPDPRRLLVDRAVFDFIDHKWGGTLGPDDVAANAEALETGDRILAIYRTGDPENPALWVIADAAEDPAKPYHRAITALFSSDY